MKITQVKINKVDIKNLKGFASITFDKSFVVKGLKIFNGNKGLFVAMPSEKGKDGEYHNTAFPIIKEFRQEIIDAVLGEYNKDDDGFYPDEETVDTEDLPF